MLGTSCKISTSTCTPQNFGLRNSGRSLYSYNGRKFQALDASLFDANFVLRRDFEPQPTLYEAKSRSTCTCINMDIPQHPNLLCSKAATDLPYLSLHAHEPPVYYKQLYDSTILSPLKARPQRQHGGIVPYVRKSCKENTPYQRARGPDVQKELYKHVKLHISICTAEKPRTRSIQMPIKPRPKHILPSLY